MLSALEGIRDEIVADPSNAWAAEVGYEPLYAASPRSRIAVIGQAPGRRAQSSGIPWDDASGVRLRAWLGVSDQQFYDANLIALVPMDFYYPGKGVSGDLPPRRDFAPKWHPRIFSELPELRLTVLIGSYAQKYYLADRRKPTLTETVRSYREYLPAMIPLVHPSPLNYGWQRRNPWFERDVLPELRDVVHAVIGQ
jgi:uracil-DNA glycosylase